MTRQMKSRASAARRFAFLMKISGMPLPVERVREAIAAGERLDAEVRTAREEADRAERARFDGCLSVTNTARELGVTRTELFRWLARAEWLTRDANGNWQATDKAIGREFVVMRGPASITWPQITPLGKAEIARRFSDTPD